MQRTLLAWAVAHNRYFLVGAIAAWVACALVLFGTPDSSIPYRQQLVAVTALIFVWLNGLFWLIRLLEPAQPTAEGRVISRLSASLNNGQVLPLAFLVLYAIASVLATVVCLRLLVAET